jgi:hypothetical protein
MRERYATALRMLRSRGPLRLALSGCSRMLFRLSTIPEGAESYTVFGKAGGYHQSAPAHLHVLVKGSMAILLGFVCSSQTLLSILSKLFRFHCSPSMSLAVTRHNRRCNGINTITEVERSTSFRNIQRSSR